MRIESISSISAFSSAWEVLEEYVSNRRLSDLTADEREALQHVDDFESYSYYVLNDHIVIVCDSITGDVIGSSATVETFFDDTMRYVIESGI